MILKTLKDIIEPISIKIFKLFLYHTKANINSLIDQLNQLNHIDDKKELLLKHNIMQLFYLAKKTAIRLSFIKSKKGLDFVNSFIIQLNKRINLLFTIIPLKQYQQYDYDLLSNTNDVKNLSFWNNLILNNKSNNFINDIDNKLIIDKLIYILFSNLDLNDYDVCLLTGLKEQENRALLRINTFKTLTNIIEIINDSTILSELILFPTLLFRYTDHVYSPFLSTIDIKYNKSILNHYNGMILTHYNQGLITINNDIQQQLTKNFFNFLILLKNKQYIGHYHYVYV